MTDQTKPFQSAPDTRVGRYADAKAHDATDSLFQSAPDTRVGRYQVDPSRASCVDLFQSAPDTRVGRYIQQAVITYRIRSFNPRPTRVSGDTLQGCGRPAIRFWFQSAPDTRVGRYPVKVGLIAHAQCFNPRPTRVSGDTIESALMRPSSTIVSIRARHACRAIPYEPRAPCDDFLVSIRARHACRAILIAFFGPNICDLRFNPRPTRVSGDTSQSTTFRVEHYVSIRARHACRAIPERHFSNVLGDTVSIRARHACRAIPRARRPRCAIHIWFQSAPDTRVGRYRG